MYKISWKASNTLMSPPELEKQKQHILVIQMILSDTFSLEDLFKTLWGNWMLAGALQFDKYFLSLTKGMGSILLRV